MAANRFMAQCRMCHCTVEPGQGRPYLGGWAHTACAPEAAPRNPVSRGPVTIHAEIVRYAAKDMALSWPYTDGTVEQLDERRTRAVFFWLPRSQVTDNGNGTITIPRWLQSRSGIGSKELAEREKAA